MGDSGLQAQVEALTVRLNSAEKELIAKNHGEKVKSLEVQLKKANSEIKDLRAELGRLTSGSTNDPLQEKLAQAVDKVDQQGGVINDLTEKLQECGRTADINQNSGK